MRWDWEDDEENTQAVLMSRRAGDLKNRLRMIETD